MKRIAAFTLAEMIIALLLTIIVISAAFSGYTMVYRSAQKIMTQTNYFADILKVDQIFRNRGQQSTDISLADSSILFRNQITTDTIKDVDSNLIYGSINMIDSFTLTAHLTPFFLLDTNLTKNNSIQEIRFSVYSGDSEITFQYPKVYAADYFINSSKD